MCCVDGGPCQAGVTGFPPVDTVDLYTLSKPKAVFARADYDDQ